MSWGATETTVDLENWTANEMVLDALAVDVQFQCHPS